jgi:cardiolipin-specific phospholipase
LASKSISSSGEVLSKTSSIQDPYGPRKWFTDLVKLSGKDRGIHEFSIERVGEDVQNNLVMLHGYGAGLGFFYKNFEELSRLPGWKLYALDLLGMGRSTRPPFRIHAKEKAEKIREAENFFIDALEEWRVAKKIDRFTLLGHSLGGYMAVAYALKYPGRLNKLILVSPVGIPEDPYAVNEDLPEPETTTIQNEFTANAADIQNPKTQVEAPRRPYPKWLTYLWDSNVSPFSLVRMGGPLGPSLVSGWTTRRFSHLPAEQAQALHDYSYSIFRQRGSGEYVLAYVLAPGAFARSPLIKRIQGVGRQILKDHDAPTADDQSKSSVKVGEKRENGIPIVFMYGDQDWMDVNGGYDSIVKILEAKGKALEGKNAQEAKNDHASAKLYVVKNAGHHVYLDG